MQESEKFNGDPVESCLRSVAIDVEKYISIDYLFIVFIIIIQFQNNKCSKLGDLNKIYYVSILVVQYLYYNFEVVK